MVTPEDPSLRLDYLYVAALELYHGRLDVCFTRDERVIHVSDVTLPPELISFLNTRDGMTRAMYHSLKMEDSRSSPL